jgi:5'-nucleotidase
MSTDGVRHQKELSMMNETIHIYHTNDLHSHFEQWPKIANYISQQKSLHSEQNERMLLFDIGDHMDRFHPISEASHGKGNVDFLNKLEYDCVTIGNNEGITLPYESLDSMYDQAEFNVIVANLFNVDGTIPSWVKPYVIYELSGGMKVGVIGLTVFYKAFYGLLGWNIKDPFEMLTSILNELRDKCDCFILLSHLGISEDERIAELYPEIDIILGGHTHHLFENGKSINETLVCGAGKYGQYIGRVQIMIDTDKKKITKKTASVIKTADLNNECEQTSHLLAKHLSVSNDILAEEIIQLSDNLKLEWFEESPFASLLATALKEWCETEISMVNAGVLLESLPKGPVTMKDLHRVCPHPINPCVVSLKGDELKGIIQQANTEKMEKLEIKGLGFRGKVMGRMIYDGIDVKTVILEDGLRHVSKILINNEPLDPNQTYDIATIDMFTFGHLYPVIRDASEKRFFMPELLRDLLKDKLLKMNV